MVERSDRLISIDWGTSSFRMRLVSISNATVLAEISSNQGVSVLNNQWAKEDEGRSRLDFFKHFLVQQLWGWKGFGIKGSPILISGMASSSIGMYEVDYRALPFSIQIDIPHFYLFEASNELSHEVFLLGGIKSDNNVMRGEETLLIGLTNTELAFAEHIVMPGTHCKHVVLENLVITDFTTAMTGELFELLFNKSILKGSLAASEFDQLSFLAGVKAAATGALLSNVFLARINHLFQRLTPLQNYHWLSGLLIGHELEAFSKINKVTLIAGSGLRLAYELALKQINPGIQIQLLEESRKLIEGQINILNRITEKNRK